MSKKPTTPSHSHIAEEGQLDWEKHLRWLAPVTAIILIVAGVFMWRQSKETSVQAEAMQSYLIANSVDDLQTLAEAYPAEPEAPLARLQAGAQLFNTGEYEKAKAEYELFVSSYPKHPMLDNAQWGIWMTEEALGDLDKAMAGFSSVTSEKLLYPQALLGQARILEKQKKPEAAEKIYSSLQEDLPDSSWAEQARIFSQRLKLTAE